MRTHRWLGALAATVLAACGSYGAPDEVLFGEAVYTEGKPGFDFRTQLTAHTYFLDPSVNVLDDDNQIPQVEPLPTVVSNAITANMAAFGYTPAPLATAEVGLHVSVLRGSGAVYYPGYWCDYWTYYGCYYSWTYAGSYQFGTIILEMAQLQPPTPTTQPIPILWTNAVYGVATSQPYDEQRVANGINRAFAQSPYLKVN